MGADGTGGGEQGVDNASSSAALIAAYQGALNLMIYEGRLAWQVLAIFVPFGTLLATLAAYPSFLNAPNDQVIASAGFVLAVLGGIGTALFWSTMSRSRMYYNYWIATAREIEKRLPGNIDTLIRGRILAEGSAVVRDGDRIIFNNLQRARMTTIFAYLFSIYFVVFAFLGVVNAFRVIRAF